MLIQVKKLTLSLLFIGLSSSAWSQAVLVKSQQKIEEYKKHLICYYENINDDIKTFLREKCLILIENQ